MSIWGDQWTCECGWSNVVVRRKCRNCRKPVPAAPTIETWLEVMAKVEAHNGLERIVRENREKGS